MPSQLTFAATATIRNSLLNRNLKPYFKPGAFISSVSNLPNQYEPSQYPVIDSPDQLIDLSPFADGLYLTNRFGPNGGYEKDISGLVTVFQNPSNQGPYGPYPPFTEELKFFSVTFQKKSQIKNEYSPRDGFVRYYDIGDIVKIQKNATYWDPPSFRPSSYSPFSVLLQQVPQGSNGSITDDSELAQIGIERLKQSYQYRVDQNVRAETLGRINLLGGLQDPVNLSLIVSGKRPLIFRDYTITSGGGTLLSEGQDIVQRIAGFTLPFSPIPGDYTPLRTYNSSQSLTEIGVVNRGGLFGLFSNRRTSPSQLFLDFTGQGQREQLTNNLNTNRYRPKYNTGGRGIISTIGQAIRGLFVDDLGDGSYYVGSPDNEPTYITSPPGEVPISEFGGEILTPVYGPDRLGKEYEGDGLSNKYSFGLAGKNYISQGNLTGGFTWLKQDFKDESGKKVGPKGVALVEDSDFESIVETQFDPTRSFEYSFKKGSILDDTQRLVQSTPQGGNRLSHVGNAINQTSKVFNDGYREITKGSRVLNFSPGQLNTQLEYCRVFTKDTPYVSFSDLQKSEGNIRKYSYSILDKTYRLNIAPEKGGDWVRKDGNEERVKKYMFSIENLAWRTSSRAGLTYGDLPACERGPNGGRIMWFPPYDLNFSEDSRPDFTPNNFLGRPEPVFTYKNTTRTGSLSWKIIVDHPSILDLVAQKVLENESSSEKADQIINSFLSGCKKYDLYDLAAIYNNVPITFLESVQNVVNNQNTTSEQYASAVENINVNVTDLTKNTTPSLNEYNNLGFYFDNNIPTIGSNDSFNILYDQYTSQANKVIYSQRASNKSQVNSFFTEIIESNFTKIKELLGRINDILSQDQTTTIVIDLESSASAPGNENSNIELSTRRNESVLSFFNDFVFDGNQNLEKYFGERLIIRAISSGEISTAYPHKSSTDKSESVNCNQDLTGNDKIYSYNAMACRVAQITNIEVIQKPTNSQPENRGANVNLIEDGRTPQGSEQPQSQFLVEPTKAQNKFSSKKLLRELLNECDYFQVLKETDSFVYNSLTSKLKYFSPSFHSMTPEGLNSRLTFLQQCTRPGDTIPTIGPNGERVQNDALNTAFGAPPVLVLRIGDFYNTKIIPTGIAFKYEKTYDLNPEGIGFQPMIVDVTLSFNFIGGSGLKGPVEAIQNALSFNYYANTEMYDERAESTDPSYNTLDQALIEKIKLRGPTVGFSNISKNIKNVAGNTIGVITPTGETISGITGTLNYKSVVNQFIGSTQNYFTTTLSFFENILKTYNYGVLSMLNSQTNNNRGYSNGQLISTNVSIYGKPTEYQPNIFRAFTQLQGDIDKEVISIFTNGDLNNQAITPAYRTGFKDNYKRYLQEYRSTFTNKIAEYLFNLVSIQENYVFEIDRFNFLILNQSDGKIDNKGTGVVYELTIDNTFNTLSTDLTSMSNDLNNFITTLTSSNLYLNNYNDFGSFDILMIPSFVKTQALGTPQQQTEFFLMSYVLTDTTRLRDFIIALTQGLDDFTKQKVTTYYGTTLREQYLTLVKDGLDLLNEYKLNSGKNFVNYTQTFENQSERIITFQQNVLNPSNQTLTNIQNLYRDKNDSDQSNPFNLKKKFNC